MCVAKGHLADCQMHCESSCSFMHWVLKYLSSEGHPDRMATLPAGAIVLKLQSSPSPFCQFYTSLSSILLRIWSTRYPVNLAKERKATQHKKCTHKNGQLLTSIPGLVSDALCQAQPLLRMSRHPGQSGTSWWTPPAYVPVMTRSPCAARSPGWA